MSHRTLAILLTNLFLAIVGASVAVLAHHPPATRALVLSRIAYRPVPMSQLTGRALDPRATDDELPRHLLDLDGRRIAVTALLLADATAFGTPIRTASLAETFDRGPTTAARPQSVILLNIPTGAPTTYPGPVARAYGTLRLRPRRSAGKITSLIELDVDVLEPAPRTSFAASSFGALPPPSRAEVMWSAAGYGAVSSLFAFPLIATLAARRYFRLHPAPVPTPRCSVCGYDLRATRRRCPECGACGGG